MTEKDFLDFIEKLRGPGLVVKSDADGGLRPIWFSEEFCSLLKTTQEEMRELTKPFCFSIVHPEDISAAEKISRWTGKSEHTVYRMNDAEGSALWFDVVTTPYEFDGARYVYLRYTDVTSEKVGNMFRETMLTELYDYIILVTGGQYQMLYGKKAQVQKFKSYLGEKGRYEDFLSIIESCLLSEDEEEKKLLIGQLELGTVRKELSRKGGYSVLVKESLGGDIRYRRFDWFVMDAEKAEYIIAEADVTDYQLEQLWQNAAVNRAVELEKQTIERQLEHHKKERRHLETILAFSQEYESVYDIDFVTDTVSGIKIAPFTAQPVFSAMENGGYAEFCAAVIDCHIVPEHRAGVARFLRLSHVKEWLAKQPYMSVQFDSNVRTHAEIKIVRADDGKGRPKRVLMGFADRTAEEKEKLIVRRRLERALEKARQASHAKTEFLSNMSHDIRTPMNAIVGFTNMALKHSNDKERVMDALHKISRSSDQLLTLINNVLDMSRIESGRTELNEEYNSIQSLADNLRSMFANAAARKSIRFHVDTEKVQHDAVLCDKLRMNQILINVLSNALKFTNEGGSVSLTIHEQDLKKEQAKLYTFTVRDTGVGMSAKFLKNIFEPFEREYTSTVSKVQGTGLGMAIVKKLVELMHGKISVKSKQGCGTTVTIQLPLMLTNPPVNESDSTETAGNVSFVGKHVLLAEDIEVNREIVKLLLAERKLEVDEAENGQLAFEMFKAKPAAYDIILMDIQMPVMNGLEAAKKIRALGTEAAKKIPIIALTANAFAEDKANAIVAGMNEHLTKPIDVKQLYAVLKKYLVKK